jgi:hypothetical protein
MYLDVLCLTLLAPTMVLMDNDAMGNSSKAKVKDKQGKCQKWGTKSVGKCESVKFLCFFCLKVSNKGV